MNPLNSVIVEGIIEVEPNPSGIRIDGDTPMFAFTIKSEWRSRKKPRLLEQNLFDIEGEEPVIKAHLPMLKKAIEYGL